jgi:hypothetical protein
LKFSVDQFAVFDLDDSVSKKSIAHQDIFDIALNHVAGYQLCQPLKPFSLQKREIKQINKIN